MTTVTVNEEVIEVTQEIVETITVEVAEQGPPGVSADHSGLLNLDADDHLHYHTDARGDARYSLLAHDHSGVYEPADADLQSHLSSISNPHSVTAAQVGADATGTAAGLIASHEGAADPHPGYALESSLGGAALLSVGMTTGTVAAGDDARFATGTTGDAFASSHPGGNQHIDWTADQDATNIHAGNIPDLSGTYATAAHNHSDVYEAAGAVSTHAALITTHGISTFGASLVDDADAGTARTTLGLGTAATTAATDYAAASHAHAASAITSGTIDTARLGSGSASASTYLRGDSTWAAAAGGVASDTHAATEKTTPVDADELPLIDSAASFVLKRLTWANVKATLAGVFPLLAGKSGGQTLIGGTGVTDKLSLQGTSGNGTVTSTAVEFKVGNNGALTALTVANNGQLTIKGDATTDLPTYGSELLTSAGWTVNSGWTESPDDVFAHSSGTGTLEHSATITNGWMYQISWTITGRTAGSITIAVGGQSNSGVTATGTFGPTATDTSAFTITPTTDFNGTLSLVSLKRISAVSTPNRVVKNSSGTVIIEERGNSTSTFVGTEAGRYNTTGSYNSFFGVYAGYANTTGISNNFFGRDAGRANTTGSGNSFFGVAAGRYHADGTTALTDPENSIYIGYGARGKDNADNNSVVIGGNTPIGLGANTTVIGTSATTLTRLFGNLGLGVDSPSASIHTIKTTEQLRLGYDATNYLSATVDSSGNTLLDGTGVIRLGDSSNYAQFATDGTITLAGTATYFDDLTFPLTQGKQGSNSKPDYDYTEIGYLFPQNDATEILYLSVQLPHRWKEGSTVYPHIHWHQAANQNVTWKMAYRWTNIGAQVSGSWTTITMDVLVSTYTSGTLHQISKITAGISGTGKTISSELQIKLYREDNVYTGDALATMFDLHIECDALGSNSEYTK